MNVVKRYNCPACSDQGQFEVCHPSTDALLYWEKCTECPPQPLVWKVVSFWESVWKMSPAELAACPPF